MSDEQVQRRAWQALLALRARNALTYGEDAALADFISPTESAALRPEPRPLHPAETGTIGTLCGHLEPMTNAMTKHRRCFLREGHIGEHAYPCSIEVAPNSGTDPDGFWRRQCDVREKIGYDRGRLDATVEFAREALGRATPDGSAALEPGITCADAIAIAADAQWNAAIEACLRIVRAHDDISDHADTTDRAASYIEERIEALRIASAQPKEKP